MNADDVVADSQTPDRLNTTPTAGAGHDRNS